MLILLVVTFVIGVLMALGGSLILIICAFSESIWWGLATLFLPFGKLLFTIVHWTVAKKPFLTGLGGSALIVASALMAGLISDEPGELRDITSIFQTGGMRKAQIKNLTTEIDQRRSEVMDLERDIATRTAALTKEYETLSKQRTALKPGDRDAVVAFNQLAEDYKTRKAALEKQQTALADTRQALEKLLTKRSTARRRSSESGSPSGGGASVVMYTTRTCPACVAAKRYLDQKGISYVNKEVDTSRETYDEFKRLGGRGVPLILINGQRMEGFNSHKIDEALRGT